MTPPNPGPMLKMGRDFPSSTPLEMSGDSWVKMWSWWVSTASEFFFITSIKAWTNPHMISIWPCACFISTGGWHPCGAGVCWSHLSVRHAFHLRQVWWSPGDGIPQRGHRWHHTSVWSHHVSARPQGRGVLCLLQQVGSAESIFQLCFLLIHKMYWVIMHVVAILFFFLDNWSKSLSWLPFDDLSSCLNVCEVYFIEFSIKAEEWEEAWVRKNKISRTS